MSDTQSKPWTRVQDWVILVAGAYLVLATLWVDAGVRGSWSIVVIGLAIVVMALLALAQPGSYIDEWMMAVAGVVAIVAPWLFAYTEHPSAAWTSWIAGAVVVGFALGALSASREENRRQHRAV
ncbi:SPW repeat domain-containing protein [Allokutzneria oryzae]|uniref:SPW repeat protein n=1 Tax=Allokutzneria oryzae TaxID=1378989 RepID=A0ABV5ZWT4_9PSEU